MIELENKNSLNDPNMKFLLGLFLLFMIIVLGFNVYKSHIFNTSEKRYTIIKFYDKYSDSKGNGMKIFYQTVKKDQYHNCFSTKCKNLNVGENRLGFYYLKDPSLYEILFDIKVPDSVLVPEEGWKEIPEFLKPK
ncbi:hypothetical protein MM213_11485 [Belliella sp. R4-6]|uniref:Uncharacterized protein n=1 Tax=Belliella alkalica TaxID=1730871 RepID=A0ABS9VCD7_9BACT|nr:hypothetical protein [Belliella alkalica]MCH7414112.1 hypothetical protein [Belliella alkalica]